MSKAKTSVDLYKEFIDNDIISVDKVDVLNDQLRIFNMRKSMDENDNNNEY